MIFIERKSTDPYFNIAAEEFVLHNFKQDVIMLWENDNSVVVGKHQNAFAEVNIPYLESNNIPLIRRISGGGTVFHGPGNINITIIENSKSDFAQVDFKRFTKFLINFLEENRITAIFEGKNNLRVEGLKISGNSAHIYKNRVMHHGTILFNTDLKSINKIMNSRNHCYSDKAVKSVRAEVGNLKDLSAHFGDIHLFKEMLKKSLFKQHNISDIYNFTDKEISEIYSLSNNRYKLWSWNYGYSPNFEYKNEIQINDSIFKCNAKIVKGKIDSINLIIDNEIQPNIENLLLNLDFNKTNIEKRIIHSNNFPISPAHLLKLLNLA